MQEPKKPLLRLRTLVDIMLGGACIVLLYLMLAQLDALKKIDADIDRLRAQVEAKNTDQARPAERAQGSGPATGQGGK